MKGISRLLILGVIAAAAIADAADAQTRYVRYEQAGDIWWGELDGSTIRQLSDAPLLGRHSDGPDRFPVLGDHEGPGRPKAHRHDCLQLPQPHQRRAGRISGALHGAHELDHRFR